MARVMFVYNHDVVAYNFTYEIVKNFVENHHEVIILSSNGPKIQEFININCKFLEVSVDRRGVNFIKDIKLIKDYKKAILNEKPDVIYTFTIKPNLYVPIALGKLKIPVISRVTGLGKVFQKNNLLFKITKILYKLAFKNVKHVYFENNENAKIFQDRVMKLNSYSVLPGSGVNLDKFQLAKYPIDNGVVKYLFLGRIMEDKGINEFIDSAIKMKEKYKEQVSFHVAGFFEDNFKEKIEELTKKNIIEYHGYSNDTVNLIKEMNCVVLPSYHEGMSNVMLESQAMGRPVIGSNIAGIKEIIIDKVSGYLVKVKDSNDLFLKLESFYNLPYDFKVDMGIKGRNFVKENFNRDFIVNEYLSHINGV